MMFSLDSSNELTGGLATKQAIYRLYKDVFDFLTDIEPGLLDTQSWRIVLRQAFSTGSIYSTFRWTSIAALVFAIITYILAFEFGHFTSSLPLMVEGIILILVLFLNCAIIYWNSRSRHLELFNKAKKLAERLKCCYTNEELVKNWASGNFYPTLNTPTSPCISLQWTYRDGQLVNLPTALLVTGDVILLNPGRTVPAKCRRIDKVVKRQKKLSDYNLSDSKPEEHEQHELSNLYTYRFDDTTAKDSTFLRGETFAPKVDNAPESFTLPRLRKAVKPCKFLILETPYITDLKATLSVHALRITPTAFEKELRLIFVRYLEHMLVPLIFTSVLLFSIIHYCYVEITGKNTDTGAATIVLIVLRPVMAIIPLLPLALPVLWLILNVYGIIRLDSNYETFSKNEGHLKAAVASNHNGYRGNDSFSTDECNDGECMHPLNPNGDCPSNQWNNKDYFLEEVDPDNFSIPNEHLTVKRFLNELFAFLYNENGNLWRTANLLHVFGSITALCCVDKKGILSWPNPTADKVFFLTAPNSDSKDEHSHHSHHSHHHHHHHSQQHHHSTTDLDAYSEDAAGNADRYLRPVMHDANSHDSNHPRAECVQLDITHDTHNAYGLQFDDMYWDRFLNNLKPLGLAILLNTCNPRTQEEFVQFSDHIACESMNNEVAVPVINKRCLCELARQIGFTPDALKAYEYRYQLALFRHIRPEVIQKGKLAKSLNFPRLKMPFPNMTCAVTNYTVANSAQLFSQGTGDLVLDTCAEYWNGQSLVMLTDYERKKILDFYQRSSLTSYCTAFSYQPLVNESSDSAQLQLSSTAPYLNDFYIELPPDSSHLFPLQRTLDSKIRGLAIDSHLITSHPLESNFLNPSEAYTHAMYLNPKFKQLGHHLSSDSLIKADSSLTNQLSVQGGGDDGAGENSKETTPAPQQAPPAAGAFRPKSNSLDAQKIEQSMKNVINEVFIGMTTLQYQACTDFVRLIELLEAACIRFVHFSKENELRSRVFSEKMGLESGWNCHISLLNDSDNELDEKCQVKSKSSRRNSELTSSSSDSSDSEERAKALREEIKMKSRRKHNSFSVSSERSESVTSNARRSRDFRSASKNSAHPNPQRNMSPSPSRVTTASTNTDHSAPIAFDMSNRAKLPKGIDNIRPHLENVDNVPLLVSLFTDCTPDTAKEMIKVMQEYEEVVCVIGSMANESNLPIFLQADASIGIDPMYPHVCITKPICPSDTMPPEHLPTDFVSPTDLANQLVALPCSLTMSRQNAIVFYQLIMNARDYMMRMRNIFQFFLSSCLSLSLAQLVTSVFFLPPLFSPGNVLWLSLIVIPILSVSLMGTQPDSSVMNVATGKKLHLNKETIVYFFVCYFIKFAPSIIICICLYAIIIGTSCGQTKVGSLTFGPCWMFSDVKADGDIRTDMIWLSHLLIGQTIASLFLVLYLVIISMGFVHRNHLLWERSPLKNVRWISTSLLLLASHICVCTIEILIYVPERQIVINFLQTVPFYVWIIGVTWPILLVSINLFTKRREIRMYSRQQRRARLEFGTKLGMNSPF